MKAILIARVSTEDQKEAGNSLPAQVVRLENYCQNLGFTAIKSFSLRVPTRMIVKNLIEFLSLLFNGKKKSCYCCDKVDHLTGDD